MERGLGQNGRAAFPDEGADAARWLANAADDVNAAVHHLEGIKPAAAVNLEQLASNAVQIAHEARRLEDPPWAYRADALADVERCLMRADEELGKALEAYRALGATAMADQVAALALRVDRALGTLCHRATSRT
ncbi:hypothetical protein [Antribacter gilvus]|uniref:hypothetical protein n=1 Tax=Antribacter gilvus TaxID=2304675 RepID=UPI000F787876|nr:hypothetical protein [Antribacter gilvus]